MLDSLTNTYRISNYNNHSFFQYFKFFKFKNNDYGHGKSIGMELKHWKFSILNRGLVLVD